MSAILIAWTIYVFGFGVGTCHASNNNDDLPDAIATGAIWPILMLVSVAVTSFQIVRGVYRLAARKVVR